MIAPKLLVIGDENAVFGFALLGVEGWAVQTAEAAHKALEAAIDAPDMGIIFLTEEWADAMRAEVDRLKLTLPAPLIVEIPSSRPAGARPALRSLLQQSLNIRLEG